MTRIRQHFTFLAVFVAYVKYHRLAVAARIAKSIAYDGTPF